MQTGHNTGRRREEEREERRGEEEERERRRRLGFGGVSAPIGCVSTLVIQKKRLSEDLIVKVVGMEKNGNEYAVG